MSIAGLDFILSKDEVVATFTASDLLRDAERVEQIYKRHVNTYVPINRAAEGQEGAISVDDFERKLIKAVKDARAPGGYITAEYGYGKTSTALYLWQRSEAANLLVVPPFKLIQLMDLLTAIYGWMRYRISVRAPHLVSELDALHDRVSGRSIEREAEANDVSPAVLRSWMEQGRFILELQASEYIAFFERVTDIAIRAGYDGLLVLCDEIQLYIEPRMKRESEPITPLFTLVDGLATRGGYLKFGLVLIIPLKEVGVIREMRDDLLHRIRNFSLDLTAIYDDSFAENLWHLLAKEFDFRDVADAVVSPYTLRALGEIAARQELSNGPRTVINAFRRMVELYKSQYQAAPYSPIDLIDDFIGGAIPFAGNDQIPNITRRALQHQIVRNDPERYEPAIKLAAAYPTNGVSIDVQRQYPGMVEILEELRMKALGELVIGVGDDALRGVTLFGLHIGIQKTDWFASTIREFRRAYGEQHAITQERAIKVFAHLLKTSIFKGWDVVDEQPSTMTSNHSIIFKGAFPSLAARFPSRRVHVRIFWEDEERKDAITDGDLAIEYYLTLCSDLRSDPEQRRATAYEARIEYDCYTAVVPLNLLYVRPEGIPLNIRQQLQDVWSPYDLSPLVLMNIYALMDEKRAAKLIPEIDDQLVRGAIQPEILDTIRKDLFNAQVGAQLGGVSQERITEVAIEKILEARYPSYKTIMGAAQWQSALKREYVGALERLNNIYQKRGEVEVEGTKEQIARLLNRTATGLDSFRRSFSQFITVSKEWKGKDGEGAVRFRLHPLEEQILVWLRESRRVDKVTAGGSKVEVRSLELGTILQCARKLGYLDEETNTLVDILTTREIIEHPQRHIIREKPSQNVDLDAVALALGEFQGDLEILVKGFGNTGHLAILSQECEKYRETLERERLSSTPDPQRVYKLGRAVQTRHQELTGFANEKLEELRRRTNALERGIRPLNPRQLEMLTQRVNGSVEYTEQVNVLRNHLLTYANTVKGTVDQVMAQVDELHRMIEHESVQYVELVRAADRVDDLDIQIETSNQRIDQFVEYYKHFEDWQRLVGIGSDVSEQLQQMGHRAAAQSEAFADLSRSIRGEISSKDNKLESLPNHVIYSPQLRSLRDKIADIRRAAEDEFISLQNRYYQALTGRGLYSREAIGSPFQYNVINPDESYRLLYDRVRKLTHDLCEQIARKAQEQRQGIQTLLYSQSFKELPEDERDQIGAAANELVKTAERIRARGMELAGQAEDDSVLRDFSAQDGGRFSELINEITDAREALRELVAQFRRIDQQFQSVRLSPEEELLLQRLPIHDDKPDVFIDLVEWRKNADMSTDEFWRLVQGLYDKRRIRLNVGKVRG
jgi:hypothetical protein